MRSGNAYVAGYTGSADYPVTPGAFDTTHNGANGDYDAFVTKVNSSGSSLAYSTFLGGNAQELELRRRSRPHRQCVRRPDMAGSRNDFPTTPGAVTTRHTNGDYDVFLTKLDDTAQTLAYFDLAGRKRL